MNMLLKGFRDYEKEKIKNILRVLILNQNVYKDRKIPLSSLLYLVKRNLIKVTKLGDESFKRYKVEITKEGLLFKDFFENLK